MLPQVLPQANVPLSTLDALAGWTMAPEVDVQAAAQAVSAIRFFHGKGWCPATSSNFSFRAPVSAIGDAVSSEPLGPAIVPQGFWITQSGRDKGEITAADFMAVMVAAASIQPMDAAKKSSAETLVHAWMYARHPEAMAVFHTHSVAGVVLTKWCMQQQVGVHLKSELPLNEALPEVEPPAGPVELCFSDYEILKGLSGVQTHLTTLTLPVFANHQDMVALCGQIRDVDARSPIRHGFLLAGHGLYTWGASIADAKRHVEVLEYLLEAELKLRLVTGGGL
jgi:methylthioribulose-1-phosphate dehydratase